MKQRFAWLVVPALALTACSNGDGGVSIEAWCELAQRIEDSDAALDAIVDDGEAAEAAFAQLRSLLDEAAKGAPDEILADVNTTANGVERLYRIIDDVDFDLSALDEEALAQLEEISGSLDDASGRIERFNERECGIPVDASPGSEPPTDTTEPATETTRPAVPSTTDVRFTGDPDSEWCVAAREIDVVDERFEDVLFSQPAEVEAYMTEFIALAEAAEVVAPPEIADAVATNLAGLRALDEAFAAAAYDVLNADLSTIAVLDAELDDANELIDAYNADVCGIEPGSDDSDDDTGGDFDPTGGSIRDQTIAEIVAMGFTEEEAACIFDGIDFTDPDFADDVSRIVQVFDECGIDLERLVELGGG